MTIKEWEVLEEYAGNNHSDIFLTYTFEGEEDVFSTILDVRSGDTLKGAMIEPENILSYHLV